MTGNTTKYSDLTSCTLAASLRKLRFLPTVDVNAFITMLNNLIESYTITTSYSGEYDITKEILMLVYSSTGDAVLTVNVINEIAASSQTLESVFLHEYYSAVIFALSSNTNISGGHIYQLIVFMKKVLGDKATAISQPILRLVDCTNRLLKVQGATDVLTLKDAHFYMINNSRCHEIDSQFWNKVKRSLMYAYQCGFDINLSTMKEDVGTKVEDVVYSTPSSASSADDQMGKIIQDTIPTPCSGHARISIINIMKSLVQANTKSDVAKAIGKVKEEASALLGEKGAIELVNSIVKNRERFVEYDNENVNYVLKLYDTFANLDCSISGVDSVNIVSMLRCLGSNVHLTTPFTNLKHAFGYHLKCEDRACTLKTMVEEYLRLYSFHPMMDEYHHDPKITVLINRAEYLLDFTEPGDSWKSTTTISLDLHRKKDSTDRTCGEHIRVSGSGGTYIIDNITPMTPESSLPVGVKQALSMAQCPETAVACVARWIKSANEQDSHTKVKECLVNMINDTRLSNDFPYDSLFNALALSHEHFSSQFLKDILIVYNDPLSMRASEYQNYVVHVVDIIRALPREAGSTHIQTMLGAIIRKVVQKNIH